MNHLTRVIQTGPSISSHNWCDANTGVHVFADRCDTNRAFNCITPLVWYQSEQSSEVNFTGQLRDTIPVGLCHEAACKNETEQDTISTFFVSQNRLERKETVAHTLLHFLYPLSVCTNISERHFPTQLCDTIPAGIVSRGRLEKETEEDTNSTHVVFLHCLMKKGKHCGLTFTFCVYTLCLDKVIQSRCPRSASCHNFRGNCVTSLSSKRKQKRMHVFTFRIPPLSDETGESMRIHFYNFCIRPLCLQKPSETIWPAQLRDTITTVIVSRGGFQKGNRRGYDVYTFRIPSQCHEKGEPLRIHCYSFSIPSRLKDKYEILLSAQFRDTVTAGFVSHGTVFKKTTGEDTNSTHVVSLHCLMKKGKTLRVHFYTLGVHSLSSKSHPK